MLRESRVTVEECRQALATVLESSHLKRSQNLQRLLTYICDRTLRGEGEQLKEYTIAVEALGRPANFDQKKDSIVRVEILRLRRRLAEYYDTDGAQEKVRIIIPEGKYVPTFQLREPAAVAEAAADPGAKRAEAEPVAPAPSVEPPPVATTPAMAAPPPAARVSRWTTPALALLLAAGALTGGVLFWRNNVQPAAPVVRVAEPLVSVPAAEVRIAAGRSKDLVDHQGNTWLADRWFTGGWANAAPHPAVERAFEQELFTARREGEFQYDIPLEPGHYELRLYFAETVFGEGNPAGGGESTRFFRIEANGRVLVENLDVLADAPGSRVADVKVFKDMQPAADGKLHLAFKSAMHQEPFVNAIELRRTAPGRIRPIRMVAQPLPVRDAEGHIWEPDVFVHGGNVVKRQYPPEKSDSPELFRGERFGTFSYAIPVAAGGLYRLTLYFSEAWWGEGNMGGAGEGSRLFDVYVNHVPLLQNLDVLRLAGGPRRPLVRTFHNLKPNARDKIELHFEASRNYAFLNALSIEDETPLSRH